MSNIHVKIPDVLVWGDTLACPHCGKTGLDNFVYVEDIQNFRELIRLENSQLVIHSFYETADDGDNPRLGCKGCDKECTIPEDLDYDFE